MGIYNKTNRISTYEVNEVHKLTGFFKVVFGDFRAHNGKNRGFFSFWEIFSVNIMNIRELNSGRVAHMPCGVKVLFWGHVNFVNFRFSKFTHLPPFGFFKICFEVLDENMDVVVRRPGGYWGTGYASCEIL